MKGWEGEVVRESVAGNTKVKTLKNPANYAHARVGETGFFMTDNLDLIEPEIKAGDRVEVIYSQFKGEKGTIKGKSSPSWYVVSRDNGGELLLDDSEFKLIPESKTLKLTDFKPGTKVKITDFTPSLNGKIGTVDQTTGKYAVVLVEVGGTKQREYLLPSEMEIVEEKETVVTEEEIKVGDKVTVDAHAPRSSFHGVEGVVISISNKNSGRIRITKITDKALSYVSVGSEHFLHNLTKVPEFTFKDIQKGDTLRRTITFTEGTKIIKEGVVYLLTPSVAGAVGGVTLANPSDFTRKDVEIELVKRPEPKTWAQEKPVGSVFLARTDSRTWAAAVTKKKDNEWQRRFLCNNNKQTLTDAQIFGTYQLENVNFLK